MMLQDFSFITTVPVTLFLAGALLLAIIVCRSLYAHLQKSKASQAQLARTILQKDHLLSSLTLSEEKYRSLFNLTLAGIFRISLDGKHVLTANTAAAQYFGYESAEDAIANLVPKDVHATREQREYFLALLAREGRIASLEARFRRKDGTLFDALVSAARYPGQNAIEGTIIDISSSKEAERLLKENSAFQQLIIDAIPIPMFYKDAKGAYRLVNKAFTGLTGLTPQLVIGRQASALFPEGNMASHLTMEEFLYTAKGPASQRYEGTLHMPHTQQEALFYSEALFVEGQLRGIIGTIVDITSRKQQEEALRNNQALLQSLISSIPDMVFFKDVTGRYLGCNEAFARHLSLTADEIIGKTESQLYPPVHAESYIAWDNSVLSTLEATSREISLPVGGDLQIHDVIKAPILTREQELLGIVGTARNITARKKLEASLRQAEARFRTIFERSVEGIYAVTVSGTFLEVNRAMAKIFGYDTPEEFLAETGNAKDLWCRPEERKHLIHDVAHKGYISGFETCVHKKNGEHFWISLSLRAIRDSQGVLMHLEGVASDITQKKLTERELALRASTDSLTGLANRARFEEELDRMLAQAGRSSKKVGLLFVDLDGFKPINDMYGHAAGDEVLLQVGKRITSRLRESDIAARFGGDEFAILLWDIQGEETLYRIGRQLLSLFGDAFSCSQFKCRLGASIGGSLYPEHGTTGTELLRTADSAMYVVKRYGKNALRVAKTESECPLP